MPILAKAVPITPPRGLRCPRQESNLRSRLRTPASYPLDHGGFAEDAGFEPARRSHADHRFQDGCLTGLGQSSLLCCPSDARESNAVTPDPKSGGVASAPRIRQPAYPPRTRRPVPLPGLEPGTSAFVVRRSVHLSYKGEVKTCTRLHRHSSWPPPSVTGTSFWEKSSVIKVRAEMAASSTGGGSRTPLETVLEAVPLPKLADKKVFGRSKKRSRPDRFPDGRLPGMTNAMAS